MDLPDNARDPRPSQIATDTVSQHIEAMRASLTVVLAYGQLVQRRMRNDTINPALIDRAAEAIVGAAMDMLADLKRLDDACDDT